MGVWRLSRMTSRHDGVMAGQCRRPSYCQAGFILALGFPLGNAGATAFLSHVTMALRHDSYKACWRRFRSHSGKPPMRWVSRQTVLLQSLRQVKQ
jgi:hypothetical protein